jgi:hypothetical protein
VKRLECLRYQVALLGGFLLVAACSRTSSGTSDVSQVVLREAVRLGGRPLTTNSLPVVTGACEISTDSFGTRCRLSGVAFAKVDAWAKTAFGPPQVAVETNLDGFPQRVWTANKVGIAIQLIGGAKAHDLILLKPIRLP